MRRFFAWTTLLLSAAFAAAPLVTAPFQGYDDGQVPIAQPSPAIQPEGWTFSIWLAIYAWLILSAVFGLRSRDDDPAWHDVRVPLAGALLLGIPWLAVANRSALLATIMIVGMALFAIAALVRSPVFDRWMLRYPVGLFAGWLTAATFVSLGSMMTGFGLFPGEMGWAWICLSLALLAAIAVQARPTAGPGYGVAVAWALVGLTARNWSDEPVFAAAAGLGAAVMLVLAWRSRMRPGAEVPG